MDSIFLQYPESVRLQAIRNCFLGHNASDEEVARLYEQQRDHINAIVWSQLNYNNDTPLEELVELAFSWHTEPISLKERILQQKEDLNKLLQKETNNE